MDVLDQEFTPGGRGDPIASTLEKRVAKMWWIHSNLRRTENRIPSVPGPKDLLVAFNIALMSISLKGLRSKALKASSLGLVREEGYQYWISLGIL